LALRWSRHIHSEKAREWFDLGSNDEKFSFCRITQITVLRLLTTATVTGTEVKKIAEAWDLWDRVCADGRIAFLLNPRPLNRNFGGFRRCGVPLQRYGGSEKRLAGYLS
jgi:uncharacterized protein